MDWCLLVIHCRITSYFPKGLELPHWRRLQDGPAAQRLIIDLENFHLPPILIVGQRIAAPSDLVNAKMDVGKAAA